MHRDTAMPQKKLKLTDAQSRVMTWMSQGWSARVAYGSAVEINGSRICNVDTLSALARMGLIKRDETHHNLWEATLEGKKLSPNHHDPED